MNARSRSRNSGGRSSSVSERNRPTVFRYEDTAASQLVQPARWRSSARHSEIARRPST